MRSQRIPRMQQLEVTTLQREQNSRFVLHNGLIAPGAGYGLRSADDPSGNSRPCPRRLFPDQASCTKDFTMRYEPSSIPSKGNFPNGSGVEINHEWVPPHTLQTFAICRSIDRPSCGSTVESSHHDEEVGKWSRRGGFRGPFCTHLWTVRKLWNRFSAGARRTDWIRPSVRAHDV